MEKENEVDTRRLLRSIATGVGTLLLLLLILSLWLTYSAVGQLRQTLLNFVPQLLPIGILFLVTGLVLTLVRPIIITGLSRMQRSRAETRMVWGAISSFAWITAFFIAIFILIIRDPGSFFGLAVVLAAFVLILQQPLLNLAAWFTLVFGRIYHVGDRIQIGENKGYVSSIGLFHTNLMEFGGWMQGDTLTGRAISIPNGKVFTEPVQNYTRDNPYIRDQLSISITYESDHQRARSYIMESAMEILRGSMEKARRRIFENKENPELSENLGGEPVIHTDLEDSFVRFDLHYLCSVRGRRETKSDIINLILDKIRADDSVTIAYPHLELVPYTGKGSVKKAGEPPFSA